MKRLIRVLQLLWFASLSLAAYNASASDPMSPDSYNQPAVKDLVRLVNDGAETVQKEGEKAFHEFRRPGRWLRADQGLYLFIFDLDGNQVANADSRTSKPTDSIGRDAWGKQLFRLAVAKFSPGIENRRFWWFHYVWYKPGESKESWKSTYMVRAQAPSGKIYIVACGLYDLTTEPLWVELLVDEAAELTRKFGAQAFAVISSHEYQFMYRDTYLFLLEETGTELANAASPEINGKNLLTSKNFPLKNLIREEIQFAKTHGEGWMHGA